MKFYAFSNMFILIFHRLMGFALTLGLVVGGGLVNATEHQPVKQDPRLNFLGKFIESSHGAAQVEKAGNIQAVALRKEARALYLKAKNSENKADMSHLLNEAAKKMFQAVKLSKSEEVTRKKNARLSV